MPGFLPALQPPFLGEDKCSVRGCRPFGTHIHCFEHSIRRLSPSEDSRQQFVQRRTNSVSLMMLTLVENNRFRALLKTSEKSSRLCWVNPVAGTRHHNWNILQDCSLRHGAAGRARDFGLGLIRGDGRWWSNYFTYRFSLIWTNFLVKNSASKCFLWAKFGTNVSVFIVTRWRIYCRGKRYKPNPSTLDLLFARQAHHLHKTGSSAGRSLSESDWGQITANDWTNLPPAS